jgi:stage II sporulation protein E
MNAAAEPMLKRGEAVAADFAMRFRDACIDLSGFINAVNAELRAVLIRRQYRSRMREGRDTLFDRFRDMSDVLASVAAAYPVDAQDERAERAEERVNLLLRGLELDADCAAFTDKGGRIHVELSGGALPKLVKRGDWLDAVSDAADCLLTLVDELPDAPNVHETIRLTEESPLSASIGVASLRRRGEDVSGDNGSFFRTDDGTLCVILSDGMGSGDAAFRDSQAAVTVLERFLKAGVAPETALRVLGAVMTLRGDESIGCATIDLLCVNLFSGAGELYKFGAAPSFIRKGAAVKRVTGDALSAGLGANVPDCLRLHLEPGAFAVIISDGVAGDDDEWLFDAIAKWDYQGDDFAKSLARSLVEQAATKYGVDDDMTALVVKIA